MFMLVLFIKEDEPELPAVQVTPIKKKSSTGSSGKTKHMTKLTEDEPLEGNVSGKRYQLFYFYLSLFK